MLSQNYYVFSQIHIPDIITRPQVEGNIFFQKTSDSKCFDLIFLHTVQEFFNSIMLMWPILARTLVRNILMKANVDYLWTYMYFFSKNYNMSIYTYKYPNS